MPDWTIEALKEHVDRRFADAERATDLAAAGLATRLDAMNEFREQLRQERGTYAKVERVEALERWQSRLVGAFALIVIVLPVATAIIVYLLTRHR